MLPHLASSSARKHLQTISDGTLTLRKYLESFWQQQHFATAMTLSWTSRTDDARSLSPTICYTCRVSNKATAPPSFYASALPEIQLHVQILCKFIHFDFASSSQRIVISRYPLMRGGCDHPRWLCRSTNKTPTTPCVPLHFACLVFFSAMMVVFRHSPRMVVVIVPLCIVLRTEPFARKT